MIIAHLITSNITSNCSRKWNSQEWARLCHQIITMETAHPVILWCLTMMEKRRNNYLNCRLHFFDVWTHWKACYYGNTHSLKLTDDIEWMNGVLGHDSALVRLSWAGDNLGEWGEFWNYESRPWCRNDCSICVPKPMTVKCLYCLNTCSIFV